MIGHFALNRPLTEFRGQRIWLIGASSGIGAALAEQLLELGAIVALSARRPAPLEQLAQAHQLNQLNHQAMVLPFDVVDQPAWQAAYQQICARHGGVDLVIFCAAEYRPERSWEVDPQVAWRSLQVNLASVYTGLATVLPDMLARGAGGVALIASVAGYMGLPGASVYGPSKAAMINLAEILYSDLHPRGINVYLINPGFVDTGLTRKNNFAMPALQTAQQAASSILTGLKAGQFEIHFPRRFTRVLKLISLLPYRWRFFLFKRVFHVAT